MTICRFLVVSLNFLSVFVACFQRFCRSRGIFNATDKSIDYDNGLPASYLQKTDKTGLKPTKFEKSRQKTSEKPAKNLQQTIHFREHFHRGSKMGTRGGRWGPKGVIVQKRFVFSNIFCLFKPYKGLSRVCNLKTSVCNIIIIM